MPGNSGKYAYFDMGVTPKLRRQLIANSAVSAGIIVVGIFASEFPNARTRTAASAQCIPDSRVGRGGGGGIAAGSANLRTQQRCGVSFSIQRDGAGAGADWLVGGTG